MPKKRALTIASASIVTAAAARQAAEGAAAATRLKAAIEVNNAGDEPLHVWATVTSYDYDPAGRKLTLFLTGRHRPTPPGIEMVSKHPRTPRQILVPPGATATIEVNVPRVIRRRVPGEGLGMSFVEEPIGPVERLEAHIQSATTPVKVEPGENPSKTLARLAEHGETVRSTIRLTGNAGYKER